MKKHLNFFTLTGILFVAYFTARAVLVGVTYDEAWTLRGFVPLPLGQVLSCTPCDANNHLLNTLLIKLVYLFSPDTVFWGRFPNLLAGFFYIFFAARIGRQFLKPLPAKLLFLLLLLNPFLLDFFSLARGYGLSISFMLASCYFLLRYRDEVRWVWLALLMASLAVLSNYSLLNFWLGAVSVVVFFAWRQGGKSLLLGFACSLVFGLALLALLWGPLHTLVQNDAFYFGGKQGFFSDTIGSLTRYSLYASQAFSEAQLVASLLLSLLGLVVLGAVFSNSLRHLTFSRAVLFSLLLLVPVLSTIAQHFLLGNLYLIERTALFFYPLFVFCLIFWMAEIEGSTFLKMAHGLVFISVVAFGINFLRAANFYKTITWEFDAHNREILETLQHKAHQQGDTLSISGTKLFMHSMLYLVEAYPRLTYLPQYSLGDSVLTDYYLFYNRSLPPVWYYPEKEPIAKLAKDTLLAFPGEAVYLFGPF